MNILPKQFTHFSMIIFNSYLAIQPEQQCIVQGTICIKGKGLEPLLSSKKDKIDVVIISLIYKVLIRYSFHCHQNDLSNSYLSYWIFKGINLSQSCIRAIAIQILKSNQA